MRQNGTDMGKAAARAQWKRIEARLLRALARECRDPAISHWRPTDVADQLDLEAERREHPERFAATLRLPALYPEGETVPQRPTYDELKDAIVRWADNDDVRVTFADLASRLRATT